MSAVSRAMTTVNGLTWRKTIMETREVRSRATEVVMIEPHARMKM